MESVLCHVSLDDFSISLLFYSKKYYSQNINIYHLKMKPILLNSVEHINL